MTYNEFIEKANKEKAILFLTIANTGDVEKDKRYEQLGDLIDFSVQMAAGLNKVKENSESESFFRMQSPEEESGYKSCLEDIENEIKELST